jgi:chemotaxis protein MotB
MRRRRHRKSIESENVASGGTSWMITFSDLCTLLLTCFVLFLSMSSLSKKALQVTFQDFDSTVSSRMHQGHPSTPPAGETAIRDVLKDLERASTGPVRDLDKVTDAELKELSSEDQQFSAAMIWIRRDKNTDGFSIVFGEKLLFESGAADLKADAAPVLEALGNFLRTTEYRAYVDGHTDALAVRSEKFTSNENLSLARTLSVMQFFLNNGQVAPERLAAGAYGSSHPLQDNKTALNRALNRRVEVIFEPPS